MPHPQTGREMPAPEAVGTPATEGEEEICRAILHEGSCIRGRPVLAAVRERRLVLLDPASRRPLCVLELARLRRLAGLPDGCWLVEEKKGAAEVRLRLVWGGGVQAPRWLRRVRKRGPNTRQWLLLAGLVTLILGVGLALALAPRHFAFLLSDHQQERLGAFALQTLAADHHRCKAGEAMLAAYLDALLPAGRLQKRPELHLLADRQVNAFALPGNRIAVFTGLLDATPDRDALAGVLAHELAHLERRDPVLALIRQQGIQLISATLLQAPVPIGALVLMRFSRRSERAADRRAAVMLRQAGFAPEGLVHFLETIATEQETARKDGQSQEDRIAAVAHSLAPYWSTHPAPGERVRLLRAQLAKAEAVRASRTPPDLPAPAAVVAACQDDATSAR
ncbi:MAG: hypothetical protein D6740_05660 [Alphaproteobacteria bacterium]|nr:MAG: hypothetical protein D6740_05660 [Alphaproteobacteria bacterium]